MKKLIIIILFLAFLSGCSSSSLTPLTSGAGGIVEGYIVWKKGEATRYYNADVETVYRAVKHASEQLKLKMVVDDQNKKEKGYHLKAGEKDKFTIKILPREDNITQLSIRVNFMGDKPYAGLFYKTVDDNLNSIQFKNGIPVKQRHKLINKLGSY